MKDWFNIAAATITQTLGSEQGMAPNGGMVSIIHPLSGTPRELALPNAPPVKELKEFLDGVMTGIEDPGRGLLACWRLLPGHLEMVHEAYAFLPADLLNPDHTAWNFCDAEAGARAAGKDAALLSFFLGPVQPFIEAARSIRDLWTGSAILSWISFQAMMPVILELGPSALVFPALRGAPLVDLQLRKAGITDVPEPSRAARKAPSMPNKFLALVPASKVESLGQACEQAAEGAWKRLTNAVRKELDRKLSGHPGWDRFWDGQVDSFFEIRTTAFPLAEIADEAALAGGEDFAQVFPHAQAVRDMAAVLPQGGTPAFLRDDAGRWQMYLELSARLMEAARSIKLVHSQVASSGKVPPKCSLIGTYEQIGPVEFGKSAEFWKRMPGVLKMYGVRIRKGERLCAVALAKRFAAPAFLAKELGLAPSDLNFPDTATLAAAYWLEEAKQHNSEMDPEIIKEKHGEWNGQWLHNKVRKPGKDSDDCPPEDVERLIRNTTKVIGPPPTYYAILAMDGDNMGKWLKGEKAPLVRKVLPQFVLDQYEKQGSQEAIQKGLDAQRPVGPAMHAAISEALSNFAVYAAPDIVERHRGVLIYAGGDDVLALLPVQSALDCARELRLAFRGEPAGNNGAPEGYYRKDGRDLLMMGSEAGLSAGIAVVHHKEDLRVSLREARQAEKKAKNSGRDTLVLSICRRSGDHSRALCPWDYVERAQGWQTAFQAGASDRWAYNLAAERETLSALDTKAMSSEIGRLFARSEKSSRDLLCPNATDTVRDWFQNYQDQTLPCFQNTLQASPEAAMLQHFSTLILSASFLARGRDE